MKFAFATDDDLNFTKRHFGSADHYLIFSFFDGKLNFESKIKNNSIEEEIHGDPKKAKSVEQILNEVDVLVSKIFGPNINKMEEKFIVVVMNSTWNLDAAKKIILEKIDVVKNNMNSKDILFF